MALGCDHDAIADGFELSDMKPGRKGSGPVERLEAGNFFIGRLTLQVVFNEWTDDWLVLEMPAV
jgi:hypothetical protein